MSRAAIMIAGNDPGYLRITEHQVRRELAKGRVPMVLDSSSIDAGGVDSFDRGTLKLFGVPFPGHDLVERMRELGVEVDDLPTHDSTPLTTELSPELEEALAIAVQSALITYYRTDKPNRSRRLVGVTATGLEQEGRGVYRSLSSLLSSDPSIDLVYLPNGRFPHQKMAHLAARNAGVAVLHFEKGETRDGTYLQPYAPQNRLDSQGAVEPTLAGLSMKEVDAIADPWLARRAPSTESSNEFAALWGGNLPPELARLGSGDGRVAGFFTSSQDEFQFLGPEWQLHSWHDQFEAFDLVMTRLEEMGFRCYLRVHPNLATKAHDCFVRERNGIRWLAARHPNLAVVWHDDFANTYALLDMTDAVIVWDSTVGLEASARGISTWTMATSRYGLVADVRELLSAADLETADIEPWNVNAHAAKRFIAYLVLRDEQMDTHYRSWLPWDAGRPPIGVRLAAALKAGSTPHRAEAIASVIDVYRHRSSRSNLRHIQGR